MKVEIPKNKLDKFATFIFRVSLSNGKNTLLIFKRLILKYN